MICSPVCAHSQANFVAHNPETSDIRVDMGGHAGRRQAQISRVARHLARPGSGDDIMAKPTTIKIRLNSTAGTGHFYVTKKNARTMTEKMSMRKFDPVVRKHVEYKEGKIK